MPFRFLHLEKVVSTNTYLQEISEPERARCVVYADEQTAGKGMGTNVWESEPGLNLTFSMGMDMSFLKAADQFLLSQAVPLGLLDVLDAWLPSDELFVKWPNDLYFGNRKLCGILINSTIHGMDMGVSVVGVGLNVNQMCFQDWPTHPISMKMVLKEEVALEPLLKQLVAAVDRRAQQLRSPEGREKVKNEYLLRMYRYHQWGGFETRNGFAKLYVDGIDEFGRLVVSDECGTTQVFDIKEIKFI